MKKIHFIGDPPIGEVFIGYERGRWPLQVFGDAGHAAAWLEATANGSIRYVWRYDLTNPVAMELVPKVVTEATLRPATSEGP
ncbi:MAG TPA: hypothetical protein VFY84_19265 [Jiangellales bacterium]|nr:hypothetical protein [Jiangellales bacterium]